MFYQERQERENLHHLLFVAKAHKVVSVTKRRAVGASAGPGAESGQLSWALGGRERGRFPPKLQIEEL